VDAQVLEPEPRKGNLVARLKGTGKKKPILWICHLDVVEARREDWTTDPFVFTEKDGWYYGRGTEDIKGACALLVHAFIRLKKDGYKGNRDLILALTAGEEDGKANGVDWLLKNKRSLVDAEFVLNPDAGSFQLENGKRVLVGVQASEKLYADFAVEAKSPGGHSARPGPKGTNAIYRLSAALARLEAHRFPAELNEVTRGYFERQAAVKGGPDAADMTAIAKSGDPAAFERLSANAFHNSRFRTTCVATRLDAGHANNALPAMAKAVVNCRILPGHSQKEIQEELVKVVADPSLTVTALDDYGSGTAKNPLSALRPEVVGVLEKVVSDMWPGLTVVPFMDAGASDSAITRAAGLPTYGVPGIFTDVNDNRAHGKDERINAAAFEEGAEFFYRFNLALTR
jgi:acetylornithine deacetylase/succinyl-diaminopimelate desuccinylase-like protein